MSGYEYRRFAPGQSEVSTFEFHEHRERAPHIDQPLHQPRLEQAIQFVLQAEDELIQQTGMRMRVVDLGCGDGGLVQRLNLAGLMVHGYDFQPSNADGWLERGVILNCDALDFVHNWGAVVPADLYVCTEVLEHLEEPYQLLRNIRERDAQVVCSSPWMEHEGNIDGCHNWAWDMSGYCSMLWDCGFEVKRSERIGMFQVHRAVPR